MRDFYRDSLVTSLKFDAQLPIDIAGNKDIICEWMMSSASTISDGRKIKMDLFLFHILMQIKFQKPFSLKELDLDNK